MSKFNYNVPEQFAIDRLPTHVNHLSQLTVYLGCTNYSFKYLGIISCSTHFKKFVEYHTERLCLAVVAPYMIGCSLERVADRHYVYKDFLRVSTVAKLFWIAIRVVVPLMMSEHYFAILAQVGIVLYHLISHHRMHSYENHLVLGQFTEAVGDDAYILKVSQYPLPAKQILSMAEDCDEILVVEKQNEP